MPMNAFSAGRIEISLGIAGGQVATVGIAPRQLAPIGRLARGKPPAHAVSIVPRLFSLCGTAHAVAAMTASEAARGDVAPPAERVRRTAAVLAERLVELLRGTITRLEPGQLRQFAPVARKVAALTRPFALASANDASARRAAAEEIAHGLGALGPPPDGMDGVEGARRWFAGGGALAAMVARADEGVAPSIAAIDGDFLSEADDETVARRLLAEGSDYSLFPDLDSRVPETGAFARHGRLARADLAGALGAARARLLARLIEIAAIPMALRAADAEGESFMLDAAVTGRTLGAATGAAAVECARGRLYHLVVLDGEGHVDRLDYVAPTEWNFHPRGPLARCLAAARLPRAGEARRAVEDLVAAFDPCVEYAIAIGKHADA
jgi:hypothetical protein